MPEPELDVVGIGFGPSNLAMAIAVKEHNDAAGPGPYAVLGDIAGLCHTDGQGRPQVRRDYRVATDPRLRCGIYLQGGTEHTHGITSALLSNTAIRVGEILDSVLQHRSAPALVAA